MKTVVRCMPRGMCGVLIAWVSAVLALGAADATDFPGNPPITPRWAFEPWVWEDGGNTASSSLHLIDGYLSRDIPVGAIILDSPWSTAYMSFEFDTARYPDPSAMIATLRAQGVQVVCWMVGMVNQSQLNPDVPLPMHPQFHYARSSGFALRDPSNSDLNSNDLFDYWKGRGLAMDFTNPNAVEWFMTNMNASLISMGVRGFKVDVSDGYLSDLLQTTPGSTFGGANITRARHAEYYYSAVCDWIRAHTGNEGVIIARPFSYQRHGDFHCPVSRLTCGWCGDFGGDFAGFVKQLGDIYISATNGYSALGLEIGGYTGANPTRDSLLRQAEYAALLPIMENGGANGGQTYHLPWYWDSHGYSDTVSIYRYYATLHHNLAPFQFHCGVTANLTGQPALSQVDPVTYRHLLGNTFLTWAITAAGTQSVVMNFPAGSTWIDWWNQNNSFPGGTQASATYAINRSPIFVRAGSIIPVNVDNNVTGLGDGNSAGKDTLLFFPWQTNQLVYHRPLGDAIAYEDVTITSAEGANGWVRISTPSSRSWIFKIKAFAAPQTVTGADTWSYNSTEHTLTISKQGSAFTVSISPLYGYSTTGGPEIHVEGNGVLIVDGDTTPASADHTDFGATITGVPVSRIFTVRNLGTTTLTTSGLTAPAGYTLTEGLSPSIAAGTQDTFTVRLDAAAAGTFVGDLSFTCNDNDEGAFNFQIRGIVGGQQEVIKDNADGSGVTFSGSWYAQPEGGSWQGQHRHDGKSGKGSKSATFTPNLPSAGSYQVCLWYDAGANRANNVPVDVVHAGLTTTVTVNQQANGSQWFPLGTFDFHAGTGGFVRIRNAGTSGYVIADAVKFVGGGLPANAVLSVNPASLTSSCLAGANAASQTFEVWNSGGGTLAYAITENTGWLSCSPTAGSSTGERDPIAVHYSTSGLTAGTYTGTISVTASGATGSPKTMTVTLTVTSGSSALIKDNADGSGVTFSGSWYAQPEGGSWQGQHRHDGKSGKGSKSATFTPNLPSAGSYQVCLWYDAGANRANNVPVDVVHAGLTTTVTVNQQANGSQWFPLGTFDFHAGTGGFVRIRNAGTSGYVIADAVRFMKTSGASSALEPLKAESVTMAVAGELGLSKAGVEDGHLVLKFLRPFASQGVEWAIEVSEDLIHWMPVDDQIEQVAMPGDESTEQVKARYLVPVTETTTRYFRVRILGEGL